jgi:hypothetical protein
MMTSRRYCGALAIMAKVRDDLMTPPTREGVYWGLRVGGGDLGLICDDELSYPRSSFGAPVAVGTSGPEGVALATPRGSARTGHLVLGATEGTLALVVELRAAKIACEASDAPVRRLEPIEAYGLGGWRVCWGDGCERTFDGVVLVRPPAQLPWLDLGLFDWDAGHPALVAGLLAPGLANLYVVGLGSSTYRAASAELLAAMIRAQAALEHPLVDDLISVAAPQHHAPAGRAGRLLERRIQRRLRSVASRSRRVAAEDPHRALTGARGT